MSQPASAHPPQSQQAALQRAAAWRRLLENPDCTVQLLDWLESEAVKEITRLHDNAPEPELRRAHIRLRQVLEIREGMASFVDGMTRALDGQKTGPTANSG